MLLCWHGLNIKQAWLVRPVTVKGQRHLQRTAIFQHSHGLWPWVLLRALGEPIFTSYLMLTSTGTNTACGLLMGLVAPSWLLHLYVNILVNSYYA